MRPFALPLLLATSACAEVQHAVALLPDGAVAWQLRVAPVDPPPIDMDAVARVIQAPGQDRVRVWSESADGRDWYVVHARFPDADALTTWSDDVVARLAPLTPVPPALRPPTLSSEAEAGQAGLAVQVRIPPTVRVHGEGLWSLEVEAPYVTAKDAVWARPEEARFEAPIAEVFSEGLSREARLAAEPPHPFAWLRDGLPSLLAAFAGLGVLVWVVRRTRKRIEAGRHYSPGTR